MKYETLSGKNKYFQVENHMFSCGNKTCQKGL